MRHLLSYIAPLLFLVLSACSDAAAQPLFPDRGAWYFLPGWLDAPAGPWAGPAEMTGSPAQVWKRALDWMAARGLNFVITDIGPQLKDRSYGGWSYHYVLKFPKYPEARIFSDAFVDRNRAQLREIFAHARKKGVRTFIHHYNFAAPWPLVTAHPELAHEKHRGTSPRSMDRLRKVAGNLCWNEPVYRAFLVECWREFFEVFPEADGILVTQGECANCKCEHCIGTDTSSEGFEHYSTPERARMLADFVTTFRDELTRMKKTPLVRRWGGGEGEVWETIYPKDITYVFKYSLFDAVDSPIDPEVKRWAAKGYRVWVSKEIGGNENAGPVAWTNPEWMTRVLRECRDAGAGGVMSIYNHYFGFTGEWSRPQQFHFELWADLLGKGIAGKGVAHWQKLAQDRFGAQGPLLLQAMSDIGRCILALPRVFGTPHEGLDWKATPPLASFGSPGQTPAAFFRGDLATLGELLAPLGRAPIPAAGWQALLPAGRKNPADLLQTAIARAQAAEKALQGLVNSADSPNSSDLAVLLPSARMAAAQAEQWRAIFEARLALAAADGPNTAEEKRRQLLRARDQLAMAIAARGRMLEAILDIPYPAIDYVMELWQGDVSSRVPFTVFTTRWEQELAALEARITGKPAGPKGSQ